MKTKQQTWTPMRLHGLRACRPGFAGRRRHVVAAMAGLCLLAASSELGAAEATEIDGTWIIESVEYGGQKIDGFAGAKLVLERGVKTFTLPDGSVERGTYTIDTAPSPRHIDTLTEGKVEAPQGIYRLQENRLTFCFNQNSTPRPTEFSTAPGTPMLLLVLRRQQPEPAPAASPASPSAVAIPRLSGTRPFYMGFTGFPWDITAQAVAETQQFVRRHGDLICHHIEGVPWTEALADELSEPVMQRLRGGKKAMGFPGAKVYLALSPGRGELKPDEKARAIPAALAGKPYDDPLVKQAYLTYCRRSIEFFKPDYLAIGIETNEIHDGGTQAWNAYAALHKHIYTELKKEHPDLPIFASFTLHNLYRKQGAMLAAWHELMPFNDLVAVSYYPFFIGGPQRLEALDWLTEKFDAFDKPYALAETGDTAGRTSFEFLGRKLTLDGTPAAQNEYYDRLLSLARERKFQFIVTFVHRDYDALWEKINAYSPGLYGAWRDCGLVDETGQPRPAYTLWNAWFRLPLERPDPQATE